jgi:hypothetical protein
MECYYLASWKMILRGLDPSHQGEDSHNPDSYIHREVDIHLYVLEDAHMNTPLDNMKLLHCMPTIQQDVKIHSRNSSSTFLNDKVSFD